MTEVELDGKYLRQRNGENATNAIIEGKLWTLSGRVLTPNSTQLISQLSFKQKLVLLLLIIQYLPVSKGNDGAMLFQCCLQQNLGDHYGLPSTL